MNKFALLIGVFFFYSAANAQLSKVLLAKRAGNLIYARETIDSLILTKTYENDAEAFFIKGLVYESCYTSTDSNVTKEVFEPLFDASDAYKKALKLNKKEISPLVNKQIDSSLIKNLLCEGYNLIEKRKITDAIRHLELYLEYKPKDSVTYLNIAVAADRIGDNELAIKYYEKLTQSTLKTPFVFKSLFFLYTQESKLNDADKMVLLAKKLYPNDIDVVKMNVNLYLERKSYEIAKHEIKKAIANPSNDATVFYYNLAKIYQIQDSINLAIANYEEAIKKNANFIDAYFNIGGIYYESARKIYEKVNAMDYGKYQKEGKKEEKEGHAFALKALPYFEKCYQLNNQDVHTKEILLSIYRNLKMKDKFQKIEADWVKN